MDIWMSDGVTFVDIYMDDEMIERALNVLESGRFVKGPECESLEERFALACDTKHAVGVSNGTAALLLSMKALDICTGDQVFVPAHTFFATVSPILALDAEPVFVDIDPNRYTMDPDKLRAAVEDASHPVCIAVTHMHGQPAEMDAIREIASEHGLSLLEDGAQAHLAEYQGRRVGSFGDVGCFSFYPTKNMTVGGDGGMIVTDDAEIAATARALRNHGRDDSGEHTHLGLNYRLNEVNAAVGADQLRHLPDWTRARRDVAHQYDQRLTGVDDVISPVSFADAKHVYHHYPIQVSHGERERFRNYLDERGIGTGVHYEVAAHDQPAVRDRVGEVSAPVAEEVCERIVSLPMHPRLTESEIESVCAAIEAFVE